MRRINLKLIIIIVVAAAVLSITAIGLRNWQKERMALGRLTSGLAAYDARKWETAASDLGRYIVAVPDDVDILLKYAQSHLNIRPLKRRNIQHAMSTYRAVLRIKPADVKAAQGLVGLYLKTGMYSEAEIIAQRQMRLCRDPNMEQMLVASLMGQRKFVQACEQLKKIIDERPDDILAYEAISSLHVQRPDQFDGNPGQWLEQAVKNNPDKALAYLVRASYKFKNDPNAARADLDKALKLDISNTQVRQRLCEELINAGMLNEAQTNLVLLQKQNPEQSDIWQTWAMWAIRTGSDVEMINIADQGLKQLHPQSWDFLPIAAELYIQGGATVRALQCLDELDKQDFAPAHTSFLQGLLAAKTGNGGDAAKFFRKSIDLGNKEPMTRMMLAQSLASQGDNNSAINEMQILISKEPDWDQAKIYFGALLIQNGDPHGAVQQANEVLRYQPHNVQAGQLLNEARKRINAVGSNENAYAKLRALAQSLYVEGKIEETEKMYRKILSAQDGDLVAMNNLAWILCEERGKYNEALDIAQNGLVRSPVYLDLLDTRGMVFFRMGNFEKAIEDFTKCVQLYPTNVPSAVASHFHLGRAYAARGEKNEAIRYLKSAIEMNTKTGGLCENDAAEARTLLKDLEKEKKS